ncbi:MAG: carboxymuconolactone decarboxylase family protein [Pseudomonadota bacterium]
MSEDKAALGREMIGKLCGNPNAVDSMPGDIGRYTIEHLFGDVWQGKDMAVEERSLVTCTVLTALGRESELKFHFPGAKRLGIPREKLLSMIAHVAHYAGWPRAMGALRVLNEVWPEGE